VAYGDQPFGLRDIKLVSSTGTQVDLPAAQTMKVTPRLKSGELSGDDSLKAVAAYVEAAEWEIEAGGITLAAYAVLTGKTVTISGSTPNAYSIMNVAAGDRMPYIKIYGQALGAGLDDLHVKLYKAKCLKLEGELKEGAFLITKCSGIAVDNGLGNGIWDWVQNETATTLPLT
jgi:hypothetical protein